MEDTVGCERSFRRVKSRTGARDLSPRDMLSPLLESAMKVTGARRGLVVVVGPERVCRADVVAGAWRSHSLAERFAASLGVHPMRVPRLSFVTAVTRSDDSQSGPTAVVEMGPGTAACVLLEAEGRVLGLIYLGGRKRGSRLAKFDVEFLEALGEHAALVLASFRLHRRIHRLLGGLRDASAAPDRGVPPEVRRGFAVGAPKDDDASQAEGRCRAV